MEFAVFEVDVDIAERRGTGFAAAAEDVVKRAGEDIDRDIAFDFTIVPAAVDPVGRGVGVIFVPETAVDGDVNIAFDKKSFAYQMPLVGTGVLQITGLPFGRFKTCVKTASERRNSPVEGQKRC